MTSIAELQQASSDDLSLKAIVSDVLRKRGVLGTMKAQLRSSVFAILKSPDDAGTLPLQLENSKVSALRETKEGRLALLLVRDLLKSLSLDYTLAVFEPEVHLDYETDRDSRDSLQALGLGSAGIGGKPLLVRLLERSEAAPQTKSPTPTPTKNLAPLQKPTQPPPPIPTRASALTPPSTTPSGPPPTKELPSPPQITSTQLPSLSETPATNLQRGEDDYEDDEFSEDPMQKVNDILGGDDDDEDDGEDVEDDARRIAKDEELDLQSAAESLNERSLQDGDVSDHPDIDAVPVSVTNATTAAKTDKREKEPDEHVPLPAERMGSARSPQSDADMATSDRSVSPDFQVNAFDHNEEVELEGS